MLSRGLPGGLGVVGEIDHVAALADGGEGTQCEALEACVGEAGEGEVEGFSGNGVEVGEEVAVVRDYGGESVLGYARAVGYVAAAAVVGKEAVLTLSACGGGEDDGATEE